MTASDPSVPHDNLPGQHQSIDSNADEHISHSNNNETNTNINTSKDNDNTVVQPAPKKSFRFWAIILALSVTGLLTALEATITSTALPTIIDALGGASLYVWVINLYFLTM